MRHCADCGYPREYHTRIEDVRRSGGTGVGGSQPHSGGRSAGTQTRRVCVLEPVDDPGQMRRRRPDRAVYGKRRAADLGLRELLRDEPDGGFEEGRDGFRVVHGPRRRLRAGETRE